MKRFWALVIFSLAALPAMAQGPWYAKGEFNGWSTDNLMTVDPNDATHYTAAITGLFDHSATKFKIATADWSTSMPGNDARTFSDAAGNITFNLYDQTTWSDGWLPNNTRRVGYSDPGFYGWEIVGSFNGWPGNSFDPNFALTSQGNGLYSGQFHFNAGIYDYKFRATVPVQYQDINDKYWTVSTGSDFSNSNNQNNQINVASNGDLWQFDLDLPHGKFRAFAVDQHGDYNGDGNTDAADFVYWRKTMPGNVAKYTEWRNNFGRTTTLSWIAHSADASFGTGGNVTLSAQGGGLYTANVTGLTAGQGYDVQVLRSDNSSHWPGTPVKIAADASGNINLKFYELSGASWNDGWQPDTLNRVGYADPQQFGWEVIGAFNGWPATDDPNYNLTAQGNGVYTGSFAMPTAGTYDFKFRKQGDWGTSIGPDFGNSAGNNSFTVAADGDIWNFELDLPHGKWRAYHPAAGLSAGTVPEPASLALAMFGLAFLGLARRR